MADRQQHAGREDSPRIPEDTDVFVDERQLGDLQRYLGARLLQQANTSPTSYDPLDITGLDLSRLWAQKKKPLEGGEDPRYAVYALLKINRKKIVRLHANIEKDKTYNQIFESVKENIRSCPRSAVDFMFQKFALPDDIEEHASEKDWQGIMQSLDSRYQLFANAYELESPADMPWPKVWEKAETYYEKLCDLRKDKRVRRIFLHQVPGRRWKFEIGHVERAPMKRFLDLLQSGGSRSLPEHVQFVTAVPTKKAGFQKIAAQLTCAWDETLDDLSPESVDEDIRILQNYANAYNPMKVLITTHKHSSDMFFTIYGKDESLAQ